MKLIYTACGLLCLILAFIGIFLPLLPTLFVILAAFCFSKGSKRLYNWLRAQPVFGPILCDWPAQHVIRFRVKCLASAMVAITVTYPIFFGPLLLGFRIALAVIVLSVVSWIWSFPSKPPEGRPEAPPIDAERAGSRTTTSVLDMGSF